MQFNVTAFSIDPTNGDVLSQPRVELIDTETNELFHGLYRPWEIEDQFTAFWNRLNPSWEHDFPSGKEKVVVVSVEQA